MDSPRTIDVFALDSFGDPPMPPPRRLVEGQEPPPNSLLYVVWTMPGRDYFGLFYVCRKKGFSALEQHMRGSQFAHSGTKIKRISTGWFEDAVRVYLAGGNRMGNYAEGLPANPPRWAF